MIFIPIISNVLLVGKSPPLNCLSTDRVLFYTLAYLPSVLHKTLVHASVDEDVVDGVCRLQNLQDGVNFQERWAVSKRKTLLLLQIRYILYVSGSARNRTYLVKR